jgi:hypothetical protein
VTTVSGKWEVVAWEVTLKAELYLILIWSRIGNYDYWC